MKKFLAIFLLLTASALTFAQCATPTKVEALASAIAHAEGFYVKGSLPNRLHNPGDIRLLPSQHIVGQVGLNKHNYVIFKNNAAGFAALYKLLDNIAGDESTRYNPDMTFNAFARKYVGGAGWVRWVKIVTKRLGVTPGSTLASYFDENTRTS